MPTSNLNYLLGTESRGENLAVAFPQTGNRLDAERNKKPTAANDFPGGGRSCEGRPIAPVRATVAEQQLRLRRRARMDGTVWARGRSARPRCVPQRCLARTQPPARSAYRARISANASSVRCTALSATGTRPVMNRKAWGRLGFSRCLVGTDASASRRAYASPSSRSGS